MRATICLASVIFLAVTSAASASYELTGTVVTPDGAPFESAQVWIVRDFDIVQTQSDSEGAFRFSNVPAERIHLVVYADGYAVAGRRVTITDDTTLAIALNEAVTAKLRAVDPQLAPLEGARVHRLVVNDEFEVPVFRLTPLGFPSYRSNAEGRLAIPLMPAGGYARLEVSHRSHAIGVLPTMPADVKVDIVLPFGTVLRGRVIDDRGQGIENARVTAFRRSASGPRISAQGDTSPDGFYRLVVQPGEIFVAAGHRNFSVSRPVRAEAVMDADTTAEDLVLHDVVAVKGRVLDVNYHPVEGARIEYLHDGVTLSDAVSDVGGRYTIPVRRGEGTLTYHAPQGMTVLGDITVPISVESSGPVVAEDIRLAAMPALSGTIICDESIAKDGFIVRTMNLDRNLITRADADGTFQFRLGELPPGGALTVRAEHALRFARGDVTIDLLAGDPVQISTESFQPNLAGAPDYAPNALAHLIGRPAPDFVVREWPVVAGEGDPPSSLKDLRGRVVVMVMWGGFDMTPIGVSRMEMLERLHQIYDSGDVYIFGIHEGTSDAHAVRDAADRLGVTFPVALDTEDFDTFVRYETKFIPQTILIDRQGRLQHYFVEDRLMELVKDLRRR